MTKKTSLSFLTYTQLYSFITLLLFGYFFFEESFHDNLPLAWLPIEFIMIWQILSIIFTIILNHRLLKALSIFLLLCNAFVFYVLYAYHIPIDKVMFLNAFQTDSAEVEELFNIKWLFFIITLGVIPSLTIIPITVQKASFKQSCLSIGCSFLIILLFGIINYSHTNHFLHRFKYLQEYLPPINYISGGLDLLKDKMHPHPPLQTISQDITPQPVMNKPNLIVFIVGETSRAANFSLNGYTRPTNQALDPYINDIVYYPDVKACGTSTAVSVPCIFSKDDTRHFKAGSETYMENLLDIFKKADYKIRWIDNDGGCKNVCDRVIFEEPCDEKNCLDDILLRKFEKKIRQTKNNQFIVLHTRGSHGPSYHLRYDSESNIYQPICTKYDLWNCSQEELINVYDNTIHYVSKFIARTIKLLQNLQDSYNPILLYTSDHGESLKENGIFLHAAPYATAPREQKEVPMLVWMPEHNNYHINKQCLRQQTTRNNYSHDNIFHSLLGISNIHSKFYNADFDIFAGCKTE